VSRLKITLVRGLVGTTQDQRRTVRSLGLRRIRQSVVRDDRPEVRGMVRKVLHLVRVEEETA
jgi:large subunit ribosomal protein L30